MNYEQTELIKEKMIKLWNIVEYEDSIYPAYIECIQYLIIEAPALLQDNAGLILSKSLETIRKQIDLIMKQKGSEVDRNLIYLSYDCISALAANYSASFEEQAANTDMIPLLKKMTEINES